MTQRKQTTQIILHCSATPEGRNVKAKDIKLWHKERGWSDIGYHYVIDLDGTIEEGRKENLVGSHCKGQNHNSIGICYIGGCDKEMYPKDTRTSEQKESLYKLVKSLMEKYKLNLSQIHAHNEFANKACPSYTIDKFRNEYMSWLKKDE